MTIQYDTNGIITQTLTEILDERENNLKPIMGEDFVIDKTTPIGNMELADASSELSIQELIAWLIPNQLDANTAQGYFLDCICEKNRIYRKQPQYTTLNLKLSGTKDTNFLSGDITIVDSLSGLYYDLNEDCTIGENGTTVAKFICQDYGENYPLNTSNLIIQTPVVGLNKVELNLENLNLVLGRLVETDEELRRRRMYSIQQNSTSTLSSIQAILYSLDGVKNVRYFENDTEQTDSRGVPMKSFEFIVDGGDENEITDVIFNNKTIGTRAFGTTQISKNDSEGNLYNIGYTKAGIVNIGIDIELQVSSVQSETWINKVKQALKDKFNDIQKIGGIIKDYNYFTVLTQFPEIVDIKYIYFYNVDEEQKTQHSQYIIGEKEIGKLDVSNVNIVITQS